MTHTRWWTYVQRISGNARPAQIARDISLDRSAPTRWSNGGGVEAALAIQTARAYGANVLEALAAAGYIRDEEIALVEVDRGPHELSAVEMLRELLRRAERTDVGEGLDTVPVDELRLAADTEDQSPDEDLRNP